MRKIQLILFAALTLGYTSCDYLDVVPKSKATENDIWKTPAEAKKFRFNMMQYMPVLFSFTKSPDQFAGDDFMSGPRSTSYWFPGKSLHYNEENPSQLSRIKNKSLFIFLRSRKRQNLRPQH